MQGKGIGVTRPAKKVSLSSKRTKNLDSDRNFGNAYERSKRKYSFLEGVIGGGVGVGEKIGIHSESKENIEGKRRTKGGGPESWLFQRELLFFP